MNEMTTIDESGAHPIIEVSTIEALNRSEIDTQIATAKKYPRSLQGFRNLGTQMVTQDEEVARESVYSLPARRGSIKAIEGPSVRFAEMLLPAYGNCRAGARVVHEGQDYITAQAVFHDLETNAAITFEVQRRIVDSKGRRYSVDMIGTTANAACSIALRNVILKGIPKALWGALYKAAIQTIAGDTKTFKNRCGAAVTAFDEIGINKTQLCEILGIKGVADLTVENLITMHGMLTSIQDGEVSVSGLVNAGKPKTPPPPPALGAPEEREEAKMPDPVPEAEKVAETAPEPAVNETEAEKPAEKQMKAPAPPPPPAEAKKPATKKAPTKKATTKKGGKSKSQPPPQPGEEGFDIDKHFDAVEKALGMASTMEEVQTYWSERVENYLEPIDPDEWYERFDELYLVAKERLEGPEDTEDSEGGDDAQTDDPVGEPAEVDQSTTPLMDPDDPNFNIGTFKGQVDQLMRDCTSVAALDKVLMDVQDKLDGYVPDSVMKVFNTIHSKHKHRIED